MMQEGKIMIVGIALAYFVILTLAVGLVIKRKVKNAHDFEKGKGGLNWVMVSFCFMLIPLGSGANMSLWEAAANGMGMPAVWWAVLVAGVFLPMMMLWFGPWVRSTGLRTIPGILSRMFGPRLSWVHASITVAAWTGIGTAETLATAAAIYGLSDGAIPYQPWCILIAVALIIAYVVFGGVMQLAWLNLINGLVMIIGSFVAMFYITGFLNAEIGGWGGVAKFYEAIQGKPELLNQLTTNADVWTQIIIPVLVLHCAACSIHQGNNQPFFAAESNKACRKGLYLAVLINGMSSVPWVVLGVVGVAIPALLGSGANLIVIDLAHLALPKPLIAVLMIALLCSTLSTGGSTVIGNATVLTNDIIGRALAPKMKDKTRLVLFRVTCVVAGLLFLWPALNTPVLFPIFIWCFSFGMPVFVAYFLGMRFKICKKAAWVTVILGIAMDFYWTFWTPEWAVGTFFELNMYPVTIVSVFVGVVLTIILPGEPGLVVQMRERKKAELRAEKLHIAQTAK